MNIFERFAETADCIQQTAKAIEKRLAGQGSWLVCAHINEECLSFSAFTASGDLGQKGSIKIFNDRGRNIATVYNPNYSHEEQAAVLEASKAVLG
ncbi:hypothetical protein [Suttonella ornithocola]|uniref:Uncharacterized protein n=2 Tax=Suttonella ornithocola TaxID=279832 RepID=A0A380MSC3_9GAMM|nr:hypothetical protein [Suttonella ornithocola]SUO95202.1 Uncharacterised protein [Suttonella ornithocola]SUQ09762.1 Uncharacterised protein [Suttonella ornithocola]